MLTWVPACLQQTWLAQATSSAVRAARCRRSCCRGLHDYDPDYQLAREHEGMWEDEWFEGGSHHSPPDEKVQEQYKR